MTFKILFVIVLPFVGFATMANPPSDDCSPAERLSSLSEEPIFRFWYSNDTPRPGDANHKTDVYKASTRFPIFLENSEIAPLNNQRGQPIARPTLTVEAGEESARAVTTRFGLAWKNSITCELKALRVINQAQSWISGKAKPALLFDEVRDGVTFLSAVTRATDYPKFQVSVGRPNTIIECSGDVTKATVGTFMAALRSMGLEIKYSCKSVLPHPIQPGPSSVLQAPASR